MRDGAEVGYYAAVVTRRSTNEAKAIAQLDAVIHEVRGRRVMFDFDLARLYGVETRALVQAVQRHQDRFPEDFAFKLTDQEVRALKSQAVILKPAGPKLADGGEADPGRLRSTAP